MSDTTKFFLDESRVPKAWYNINADMPVPPEPVLHPQTREMPHHWQKLAVEEKLLESGLHFCILQPSAYMQNIAAYWEEIVGEGRYTVPYGEGGALSLVDLEDVAEAAAIVLTDSNHDGATYELAGPDALSPVAIADLLSERLGRAVTAAEVAVDDWERQMRSRGASEYAIDALSRMFRYYDRHGLRGSSRVLEWLLGRPPGTLGEFLARIAES